MRATNPNLSYIIDDGVPKPQPIFQFIQEKSGNSDEEMYGNFNMGAGFAIFMPQRDVEAATQIAQELGLNAGKFGYVYHGPKRVHITSKHIIFTEDTLGIR